jgi:glycosyltransferase involved in cell wall biosynthesis
LKVIQLNHSDINGGAARAAYRIHHALLASSGIDSVMYVNSAIAGDWTVSGLNSKMEKAFAKVRPTLGGLANLTMKTGNPIIHSPALFRSNWPEKLNVSNADVVHMHWVAGEMLSIADIGRITKPLVWTLHDMWAFCGAEHYTEEFRWREGYMKHNRPAYESGFDLNRWVWERKRKHWLKPMQIVTPSCWLAQCVQESALMKGWPVTIIPNALDTDRWVPVEKQIARRLLNLPPDVPIVMFGALGGGRDPRKGYDLLQKSLKLLRGQIQGLELVVFGQLAPKELPVLGFPIHYTGHLHDDVTLQLLYSAIDVMVVPSRLEAFGQTASEAHACGTPVVAFNIGGLPDIIDHERTGYLAQPFDVEDLAKGIHWVLNDAERYKVLSHASRKKAVRCFDCSVVAEMYRVAYEQAIIDDKSNI